MVNKWCVFSATNTGHHHGCLNREPRPSFAIIFAQFRMIRKYKWRREIGAGKKWPQKHSAKLKSFNGLCRRNRSWGEFPFVFRIQLHQTINQGNSQRHKNCWKNHLKRKQKISLLLGTKLHSDSRALSESILLRNLSRLTRIVIERELLQNGLLCGWWTRTN